MEWLKITVLVLFFVCVLKCSAMLNEELEEFSNFLTSSSQLDQNLKKETNSEEELDEDEPASDHAWEESGKFEGDLILNERQRKLILEDVAEGLSRNGVKDSTKRWPNNEVIYYIQKNHFTGDQVQAIQDGIDDLAQASCVKFRPYRKGDSDAVVIQGNRRGCFSQVGYQSGYQVLNLSGRHPVGRGCFRHGTVIHELLHTLGFYHMQSSPDRDDHVDVIWENIRKPARHNFRKYNNFAVSDFGVGYDYDSVLHYSKRAFSRNGQDTIIPKKSGAEIGQRIGLSDKDSQKLNKMYCDADSGSFDADEEVTTKKPLTKKKNKKPKNKPFEGHGIGYHKGKTVVINLPTAETYTLPDLPSYHVFDYFSKAPQALLPTLIEGLGVGKEVTNTDKTLIPLHEFEKFTPSNTRLEVKKNISKLIEKQYNILKDTEPLGVKSKPTKDKTRDEESLIYRDSNSNDKSTEIDKEYLHDKNADETFDRLGHIIKTHVYPSQQPNLDIYKINTEYIKNLDSQKNDENERESTKVFETLVTKKVKEDDSNLYKPIPLRKINPYSIVENILEIHGYKTYGDPYDWYKSTVQQNVESKKNKDVPETELSNVKLEKDVRLKSGAVGETGDISLNYSDKRLPITIEDENNSKIEGTKSDYIDETDEIPLSVTKKILSPTYSYIHEPRKVGYTDLIKTHHSENIEKEKPFLKSHSEADENNKEIITDDDKRDEYINLQDTTQQKEEPESDEVTEQIQRLRTNSNNNTVKDDSGDYKVFGLDIEERLAAILKDITFDDYDIRSPSINNDDNFSSEETNDASSDDHGASSSQNNRKYDLDKYPHPKDDFSLKDFK